MTNLGSRDRVKGLGFMAKGFYVHAAECRIESSGVWNLGFRL